MIESKDKDGKKLFSLSCDNCGNHLRNMYHLGGVWNFRVEMLDFAKKRRLGGNSKPSQH